MEPDWSLWRSFAAVVESGSLSGAARKLGLTQPTLGRHVEALEVELSTRLFERTLQGLNPTDAALRLYEPVRQAQQALSEATMIAEPGQRVREGELGAFSACIAVRKHGPHRGPGYHAGIVRKLAIKAFRKRIAAAQKTLNGIPWR